MEKLGGVDLPESIRRKQWLLGLCYVSAVAYALALIQKAGPPTLTMSPGASYFNNRLR